MSNSSLLKNVPPFLPKPTAKKLWEGIKQPFAIAIFASLGVHGLLWVGLPLLPSANSPSSENQRKLNVVELSPLEQQARLPQSSLFLPLPKVAKSNPQSAKNSSSQFNNSFGSNVPIVPTTPTLPSPNPYYQIPDSLSSPSFTPRSSTPTSPTTSTRSKSKPKVAPDPTPATDPDNSEEPTDKAPNKPADKSAEQASTSAGDLGTPLAKNRDDQNKALQARYAYNPAGTTDQEIKASYVDASDKIDKQFNIHDWEKPIKTYAPYPKEACQVQHNDKPIKGVTGLVVVLQPDGALANTAVMIKSSGSKGLDETARKFVETKWNEIVKQNKLEVGSKPKAIPLEIAVEPAEGECAAAPKPAS